MASEKSGLRKILYFDKNASAENSQKQQSILVMVKVGTYHFSKEQSSLTI